MTGLRLSYTNYIAESDGASVGRQIRCWQEVSKSLALSWNHKKIK